MTAIIPPAARRATPLATLAALVDPPRDRRRIMFAAAGALVVAFALVLILRSGGARSNAPLVLPVAPATAIVAPIEAPPAGQEAPGERPEPAAAAQAASARPARERAVSHHASHTRHVAHASHGARQTKATRRVAMAKAKTKAGATAARGVGADAGDPRPAYERGTRELFAGDDAGAIAAYRDAVHKAPHDPIGYRGLGLAYEQKGDTAAAIRALRQYLKLAPSAPDRAIIARRIERLSKAAGRK